MLDIVSYLHRLSYTLCKIYILFQALSTCIDEHGFVLAVESHKNYCAGNKTNRRETEERLYLLSANLYLRNVVFCLNRDGNPFQRRKEEI